MKYTLKHVKLCKRRDENMLINLYPAVRLKLMSNGKQVNLLKKLSETNFIKTQFILKN